MSGTQPRSDNCPEPCFNINSWNCNQNQRHCHLLNIINGLQPYNQYHNNYYQDRQKRHTLPIAIINPIIGIIISSLLLTSSQSYHQQKRVMWYFYHIPSIVISNCYSVAIKLSLKCAFNALDFYILNVIAFFPIF